MLTNAVLQGIDMPSFLKPTREGLDQRAVGGSDFEARDPSKDDSHVQRE